MNETTTKASWRDRAGPAIAERLASILVLLDTRYLPLLLLAAPQSYAVFQWLWGNSDQSIAAWFVAALGAAAFEFSYIGSVAWAENSETNDKQRWWIYATALSALGFSILVAIRVYFADEGWWALLHAGFPLVNCIYTVTIHSANKRDLPPSAQAVWRSTIEEAVASLTSGVASLTDLVSKSITSNTEATDTLSKGMEALGEGVQQSNAETNQQFTALRELIAAQQRTATETGKANANQIAALHEAMTELRASLAAPALTHVCPDCGRGFTSASALGGHRSSCKGIPAHSNGHGGK